MEVILFRALTAANIDPDTAQRVVDAVEEHIDVAVGQANKGLEAKLDGLQSSLDGRFDSLKTAVDQTRVWLVIITSIIGVCALFGTILGVVAQFMRH